MKLIKPKIAGIGGGYSLKKPAKVSDPLAGVAYTGNEEADSKAELNAMQLAFKARREREKERYENATDSEFWVAVVFRTRAQKEAFLQSSGLDALGDKYLDGEKVAQHLNITLESR